MKLFVSTLLSLTVLVTPCFGDSSSYPDNYASRGIVHAFGYRAQENTVDSIMAIAKWNKDHFNIKEKIKGCEVHIIVTNGNKNPDGRSLLLLSHEENALELTGKNIVLRELSRQQISELKIKKVINGIDYGKERSYAYLNEVLEEMMRQSIDDKLPFILWLNVKDKNYKPNPLKRGSKSYTTVEFIKTLKGYRQFYLDKRNIDIFNYIIVSSDNPFIVMELAQEKKVDLDHLKGLEIMPDYDNLGHPELDFLWKYLLDKQWFEKMLGIKLNWVASNKTFLSQQRINHYHQQGTKVMGWGYLSSAEPSYNPDAILLDY